MRLEGDLTAVAVNRYCAASVIDEHLLAREVPLAHRALQALLPVPINLAERASLVRRRTMLGAVFLPQQLQGHMPVAFEFAVDPCAVRGRPGGRFGRRHAEHSSLELNLGELLGLGSLDSAGAQCPQILRNRSHGPYEA